MDVANSSQLALELEIEDDGECSQSSVEPFWPRRKSPSELFTPIRRQIQVISDEEIATALSEISDNRVLLTDVTLHAFIYAMLIFPVFAENQLIGNALCDEAS